MNLLLLYALLLATVGMCNKAYASHDPRCNPDLGVRVCVVAEYPVGAVLKLQCVENEALDLPITTPVTWLRNGQLFDPDGIRVHRRSNQLVFDKLLVSDEANWTCSNGSSSPPYQLFGK